ncbi:DNA-processing protein DprA [Pantoea sp.]|uniref:DNA-processing protein DprA n=1 Tax=Pantoea sp. TaxID=69393 RepID=UPI0031DC8EA8
MNLSPVAQATLLLTSHFSSQSEEESQPLSNAEWGRFALWLKHHSATPADLLSISLNPLLAEWSDARISRERIEALLNRGHSLALAVERWQRAGLWLVTRSDADYPKQLKQQLKTDSPPVLFGCGNKSLLNSTGLAVIGSRNASENDLAFSKQIGEKAALANTSVISGGARGVDEAAMLGAMHHGGNVIGVLSDSLLAAATSVKWRKGLMNGNLLLISPFYPEAKFSIGNAMARNKYVYCLAKSALVVHAGQKGGTLAGAEENLRKHWVPLWAKPTDDPQSSNAELIRQGAQWCAEKIEQVDIGGLLEAERQSEQHDLFATAAEVGQLPLSKYHQPDHNSHVVQEPDGIWHPSDFYLIFLAQLPLLAAYPITLEELSARTGLHHVQLTAWLQRAVSDDVIAQSSSPERYQWKVKV